MKKPEEIISKITKLEIDDTFSLKKEKKMPATTGERLIGESLEDIAPNHRARYQWAIEYLKRTIQPGSYILDAASGVGYGSFMLAEAGFRVLAVDRAEESRVYQKFVFKHDRVKFIKDDIFNVQGKYDAAVSLETIEHVPDKWLSKLRGVTKLLVGTVPNQDIVPFDPIKHEFHLRHYTKSDLLDLLPAHGWNILPGEWATQYGKWEEEQARMRPGDDGMTLGFVAEGI